MTSLNRTLLIFASLFFVSCNAIRKYRTTMPNPDAHQDPSSGLRCAQLGHENCRTGKETVNQFGKDYAEANYTWTKEFCEKDSDGDGVTNGAELGDPCCQFAVGDTPARTTDLSHPGEANSMPQDQANRVCSTSTTDAPTNLPDANASPGGSPSPGASPSSSPGADASPATSPTAPPVPPVAGASPSEGASPAAGTDTSTGAGTNNTAASTDPVCFPATAKVTLESGVQVPMMQVRVGDRVMVGQHQYSEVFMFTHALGDVRLKFVSLKTAAGNVIQLTSGHHIYASGKLVRADQVQIGAKLRLADGTSSPVVNVGSVIAHGLFNPQTVHGDIVVDGVVSSTYTEFISFSAAHALLSPLRMLYTVFGLYTSALERGVESYFA